MSKITSKRGHFPLPIQTIILDLGYFELKSNDTSREHRNLAIGVKTLDLLQRLADIKKCLSGGCFVEREEFEMRLFVGCKVEAVIHLKKADFGLCDRNFNLHFHNRLKKVFKFESSVVVFFKRRVVRNSFAFSNPCNFSICLNCKLSVNCRYISIHRCPNWVIQKSVQMLIISRF